MSRHKHNQDSPVAEWDIPKLIAVCGGIESLIELHAAHGFPELSYSAIASWKSRDSIPGDRLAEVFVALRAARGELDLWSFIKAGK